MAVLAFNGLRAGESGRIFAPYFEVGVSAGTAPLATHRVLAFIVADSRGDPVWEGRHPHALAPSPDGPPTNVSFGGESGTELAVAIPSVDALTGSYAKVIREYHVGWADFDVEGPALKNSPANQRRNAALARLQVRDPGLRITYTLPVDPEGLSPDSLYLLRDAAHRGIRLAAVNVMIMDFSPRFMAGNQSMAEVGIASAEQARRQLVDIAPEIPLGLTAMIGKNDVPGEEFTVEDARRVADWARRQPRIGWLSYWRIGRNDAPYAAIFAQWAR